MENEIANDTELIVEPELEAQETALAPITDTTKLNKESLELINKIIQENDADKQKDLTYLFNINQNKKTMVRVNKLNTLLDALTDQTITRVTERPDEISNKELIDSLKVVNDLIERGQTRVNTEDTPFIQINQQNTEVNLGDSNNTNLNRESREKVKQAVLGLLGGIDKSTLTNSNILEADEIQEAKDD